MTTATAPLRIGRVRYANSGQTYYRHHYNCHGATLYVLGVVDQLYWADWQEITNLLMLSSKRIYRPRRVGDILTIVTLWVGSLEHTAVYLGKGKYFHKRGSNTPEITDLAGVKRIYDGKCVFWRMNVMPDGTEV